MPATVVAAKVSLSKPACSSLQHAGTIHGDKKRDVVPNIKNAAQKGGGWGGC